MYINIITLIFPLQMNSKLSKDKIKKKKTSLNISPISVLTP